MHTGPGLDRDQYKEEELSPWKSVLLTLDPADRHYRCGKPRADIWPAVVRWRFEQGVLGMDNNIERWDLRSPL